MSQAQSIEAYAFGWSRVQRHPYALPVVAIVMLLLARIVSLPGVDVATLLTWAEHMLDGARPSIDFTEVNPPGSYLLYVPAAALGRLLSIRSELATEILVLGLLSASLLLCWRALAPSHLADAHNRPALLASAILVLGVMPAITFAQREHIGLVLLLPLLAATAAHAAGHSPSIALRVLVGFLAGLSVIAKPHLVLMIGGAFLYSVWVQRSLRPFLRIEWYAAAVAAATYLTLVAIAIPEFYTVSLPLLVDVYLPVRFTLYHAVLKPILPMAIIVVLVMYMATPRNRLQPVHWLLGLCSAIGIVIYYLQAKGYPYHALPTMLTMMLAVFWELTRRLPKFDTTRRTETASAALATIRPLLIVAVSLPMINYYWFFRDQERDLKAIGAIISEHRPRPTMMAIALDISIGHPLVRMVKGKWVHDLTHMWSTQGVYWQLALYNPSAERRERLIKHMRAEMDGVTRTLERAKPEIVLVQTDWTDRNSIDMREWAKLSPSLAAQLGAYSEVGRIDDVVVLARKP